MRCIVCGYKRMVLRRNFCGKVPKRTLTLSYSIAGMDHLLKKPPLLIMHGLLGNKKNFNLASRLLQRSLPDRAILSCDIRNHGESPHSDSMDYSSMGSDVLELLDNFGVTKCVLIGHSLGGRVAMHVALVETERVDRLVVVDISPGRKGEQRSVSGDAYEYIEAMKRVKFEPGLSRSETKVLVEKQLENSIPDKSIRDFVLTNLVKRPLGDYGWRVNIDAILNSKYDLSHIGKNENFTPYVNKSLFVGGALSDYITSNDIPEIRRLFPHCIIEYIPNCGHWVHADDPHSFANVVSKFILTDV